MPIDLAPVVSLDGATLAPGWQQALIELRVERQYQVPGRATLRFSDPGYELLQSNKVKLGTSLKVSAAETELVLIEAEVTSVAAEQRFGEHPELLVVAHDKSHRLGRATEAKTYLNMTSSDVVSQLATSSGLTADTDSSELQFDYLMQVDSHLGLLTELARRLGFDWWVEGSTLNFKRPVKDESKVKLALGEELRSFSARASGHHPDSVTIDGWDRKQQTAVTATASTISGVKATSTLADLVSSPGGAFGSATLTSSSLSAHSQTEAEQLSKAVLNSAGACAVSAQGLSNGNGHIKLGSTVEISQAGPLSGEYPVTRVEHLFRPGSGFVTRFYSGDRRPTSLVDTLAGSRAAARPATMHAGLSVGQVTNINDPDNVGRVKVQYPGMSTQSETDWARTVTVGGGKDRGSVFIPEVDDEVLVAFEGGDPRQPVVIGGLYGTKSTFPTTTIADGSVQQRGITSRLGHRVFLLDGTDPAKQAILLQLAGEKHSIHLGKDKLAITVPSGTPIEITAGSASFKFGNDGAITMSAPSVSITADQKIALSAPQVQVSADAQLNLQSDGVAALKGATLQVQSEGPLSMTGEPVSIN